MTTIGIIGAGRIGSQIARKAVEVGYDVVVSNSRGPETLADLVAELGPRARAATAADAAAAGDFAVVTVPLKSLPRVPVGPLAGKVVIDTNNYYWERDGHIEVLDEGQATTSGLLQEHLPTSKVAKGFNHILYTDITTDGTPAGAPGRRALATASDSHEAGELVRKLYDEFGFDTVNIGPLGQLARRARPPCVQRRPTDRRGAHGQPCQGATHHLRAPHTEVTDPRRRARAVVRQSPSRQATSSASGTLAHKLQEGAGEELRCCHMGNVPLARQDRDSDILKEPGEALEPCPAH